MSSIGAMSLLKFAWPALARSALQVTGRRQVIYAGLIALLLNACAGYVPGQQSYWDQRVKEMCAKDGGLRIFDRLKVPPSQVGLLGRADGMFAIPIREAAHPNAPAYAVIEQTLIHRGNPEVSRTTTNIIRRSDGAVIATSVIYGRYGGDFPSHAQPSSRGCPDSREILAQMQSLFDFTGDAK